MNKTILFSFIFNFIEILIDKQQNYMNQYKSYDVNFDNLVEIKLV